MGSDIVGHASDDPPMYDEDLWVGETNNVDLFQKCVNGFPDNRIDVTDTLGNTQEDGREQRCLKYRMSILETSGECQILVGRWTTHLHGRDITHGSGDNTSARGLFIV